MATEGSIRPYLPASELTPAARAHRAEVSARLANCPHGVPRRLRGCEACDAAQDAELVRRCVAQRTLIVERYGPPELWGREPQAQLVEEPPYIDWASVYISDAPPAEAL